MATVYKVEMKICSEFVNYDEATIKHIIVNTLSVFKDTMSKLPLKLNEEDITVKKIA